MNQYVPREGMETNRCQNQIILPPSMNQYVPREGMETGIIQKYYLLM